MYKKEIMTLPKKDTNAHKIAKIIYQNGDLTFEQIYQKALLISSARRQRVKEALENMIKYNYILEIKGIYKLTDTLVAHLEDLEEFEASKKSVNVVESAYRNIFTPELKNYEQRLFANKRNYLRN